MIGQSQMNERLRDMTPKRDVGGSKCIVKEQKSKRQNNQASNFNQIDYNISKCCNLK